MLATLTSRELTEWRIYEAMEPFGERAAYLRSGIIAALLYNVNRGSGSEPMKPEDFMPETLNEQPKNEPMNPVEFLSRRFGLTVHEGDADGR